MPLTWGRTRWQTLLGIRTAGQASSGTRRDAAPSLAKSVVLVIFYSERKTYVGWCACTHLYLQFGKTITMGEPAGG